MEDYCVRMDPSEDSAFTRFSPLRGGLTQESIVDQMRNVRNGLSSLKDDHYNKLSKIRDEYENEKNFQSNKIVTSSPKNGCNKVSSNTTELLEDRIAHVTHSLEALEMGLEESSVIITLYEHFNRLEADRSILRLEMNRVIDENDWLRDELTDTQKRLQDALADLAVLQDEKRQWEFKEELRNINELNTRPVTPSKIPVGSWRVEEEKELNRALAGNGCLDSNRLTLERSASPATSKIPVGGWRSKVSVYKKVMEKQEETKSRDVGTTSRERQFFKINASKIPTR